MNTVNNLLKGKLVKIEKIKEKPLCIEIYFDDKKIVPSYYRNKYDGFSIFTKDDIFILDNILNGHIILYNNKKYLKPEFITEIENIFNKKRDIEIDYLFSFIYKINSNIIDDIKDKQITNFINKVKNDKYLLEFQKVSLIYYYHKLINRNIKRIIIGDERGLGKTIQSLKIIEYLNLFPALIICPSYLKLNWIDEIKKFTLFGNNIFIIDSKQKLQTLKFTKSILKNIYITTYKMFELYNSFTDILINHNFKSIILDEVHYIKNEKSKRTKNILNLINSLKDVYVIGLTGTPIWNKPEDAFIIVNLFYPELFRNKTSFIRRYCNFSLDTIYTKKGERKILKIYGYKNLYDLGYKMRQLFMIRRTKSKVLPQLPNKIRTKISIDINEEEIKKLNKEIYLKLSMLKNKQLSVVEFLSSTARFSKVTGLYKIPYCIDFVKDILDENQNKKIVIFFYHREVGETLKREFDKLKIGNVLFIGGLKDSERKEILNNFKYNERCKIFLGSIRACGLGINLTESDTCIFIENDLTPTLHLQAEDRLHRIGSEHNSINIYYLCVKNTIDEKIVNMIIEKSEYHDRILHEDKDNKIEFDYDEILKIL